MDTTKLAEADRLQLELANERVQRAQAEALAAALRVDIANLRGHIVRIEVSHKYGLVEGDNMNFDTGEITRKAPAAEPALSLVPPRAAQS